MYKIQCLLALIALSIGAVHSWDVAITIGDQIELYTNQTKTTSPEGEQLRDLSALAYDAVHNMLLFVDKQNDNASIFSYNLSTKKYKPLVRRKYIENIQGVAFDPITNILFWTDSSNKSIFWMSLKAQGTKNGAYGDLLFKMDNEIPRAIAVDSCRGYVYWTNTNITKATIERARFDGSEREVIIQTNIYMPVSLVIDQKYKRLYWIDDKEGIHYSIESSDLDGNSRHVIWSGINHSPNSLTLSKDSIYWVDWAFKTVWKLRRDVQYAEPVEFTTFPDKQPFGIVANYDLLDQTEGAAECETLRSLAQNRSTVNESFSGITPEHGIFCLHGTVIKGKSECKCSAGYSGERCETSVCQNYCLKGDCSIDTDGNPICRCDNGFKGDRCEVNVCHDHCLNSGVCLLNEKHEPVCNCLSDHEGDRCQFEKVFTTSTSTPMASASSPVVESVGTESCNCTQKETNSSQFSTLDSTNVDFVTSCMDGWDSIRDPIIMVLGVLCGVLFLACAVLVTKILQLKKRPRIKKRIIINKNVTPMTARPDQCEITIENCCNMNICETPCFEPRTTIRPTLLDAKPGKEEKKNLIANMEYPDDY